MTIDMTKGDPTPSGVLHVLRPAPLAPVDPTEPVLPATLRDRDAVLATLRRSARVGAYRARRLALRGPVVLVLLVVYIPRGLARVVALASRWIYDSDTATLRHEHAGRGETPEALKAQAMRRANLHARWYVAGAVLVPVLVPVLIWTSPQALGVLAGVVVFALVVKLIPGRSWEEVAAAAAAGGATWWFLPGLVAPLPGPPVWVVVLVLVLVGLGLGWIGRPKGKALAGGGSFALPSELVKPTADLVVDALVASVQGVTEKTRDDVRVHAPGVARGRQGYELSLELPPGVTVSDVMEKREEFAAALRRQIGCIWPSKGHMHPGHLRLFIGDEPMATAPQSAWKLAADKVVDIFDALDLFTDQEGAWVSLRLMYKALVVGGAPGYGKTFLLRALGVAVARDVRPQVVILDGKANGDMRPARAIAHGYHEGDEPEEIAEQLAAVQDIREEMRRRARFLRELPAEENPEDKVTSALVDRYPHLAPIILLIDECQVYTEHEDKKVREAFIAALADIVRRGRSAGIVPVFCTQKPSADVLPTSIVDNCSVRICFKVNGQRANDAVLGNEMHSSGIKATKFGPDDKGLAWLKGDGAEPIVVRTPWGIDKPTAEAMFLQARAARERAGMLTGHAAGETKEPGEEVDLLDDVRDVMDHPPVPAMHLAELRDALALLRPATWGHLDNDALGGMLRQARVRVGTVWSKAAGKGGKGVKREWLDVPVTADEQADEDEGGDVVDLTERRQT